MTDVPKYLPPCLIWNSTIRKRSFSSKTTASSHPDSKHPYAVSSSVYLLAALALPMSACQVPGLDSVASPNVEVRETEASKPMVLTTIANYTPPEAPQPVNATPPQTAPQTAGGPPALIVAARQLEEIRSDTRAIDDATSSLRRATTHLTTAMSHVAPEQQDITSQIRDLERKQETEKRQVIENRCCSECGRTQMELEARGGTFAAHLSDVAGTKTICKPEKLAQVAAKYQNQLRELRGKLSEIDATPDPAALELRAKVNEAQAKLEQVQRDHAESVQRAQAKVRALGGL